MEKKIERCGFCGRYVIGDRFLEQVEVEQMRDNEEHHDIPLGFCPEAQKEHYEQNPEEYA